MRRAATSSPRLGGGGASSGTSSAGSTALPLPFPMALRGGQLSVSSGARGEGAVRSSRTGRRWATSSSPGPAPSSSTLRLRYDCSADEGITTGLAHHGPADGCPRTHAAVEVDRVHAVLRQPGDDTGGAGAGAAHDDDVAGRCRIGELGDLGEA